MPAQISLSDLTTTFSQFPIELQTIDLHPPGQALVLAPHPDDFDAISVTLKRFHEAGWSLHLAVLTGGASGISDGYPGAETDEQKIRIREAEQLASADAFGLPATHTRFLRLPVDSTGKLAVNDANRNAVMEILLQRKPQVVFMPHGDDTNATHRRCFRLFERAISETRLETIAWFNRDAKTRAMRDDIVCSFAQGDADWKGRLLKMHASQQARNIAARGYGFDERVLMTNRDIASKQNVQQEYAESFEWRQYPV